MKNLSKTKTNKFNGQIFSCERRCDVSRDCGRSTSEMGLSISDPEIFMSRFYLRSHSDAGNFIWCCVKAKSKPSKCRSSHSKPTQGAELLFIAGVGRRGIRSSEASEKRASDESEMCYTRRHKQTPLSASILHSQRAIFLSDDLRKHFKHFPIALKPFQRIFTSTSSHFLFNLTNFVILRSTSSSRPLSAFPLCDGAAKKYVRYRKPARPISSAPPSIAKQKIEFGEVVSASWGWRGARVRKVVHDVNMKRWLQDACWCFRLPFFFRSSFRNQSRRSERPQRRSHPRNEGKRNLSWMDSLFFFWRRRRSSALPFPCSRCSL